MLMHITAYSILIIFIVMMACKMRRMEKDLFLLDTVVTAEMAKNKRKTTSIG